MKLKLTLAVAAVAALAISATSATAGSGKTDKVTGGGQILFSTDDVARSTLAFTAQGTTTVAKGQVQFIDRSAGKGQSQVKYHGIVDCVETLDNFGVVSGYQKGDTTPDEGPRFMLRVIDNGEGANAQNDMIEFNDDVAPADDTCQDDSAEDDNDLTIALAKGNAQVKDGNPTNAPEVDDGDNPGPDPAAALNTTLALF